MNILPFDNFSNWIFGVCVVTFDLELGQTMELIYPNHVKLSDIEKSNVNYSSFPDSNSGCMGDTIYHFRMRMKSYKHNVDKFIKNYPDSYRPCLKNCFGYVNFRQVRDKSIRRGYFQKSVVVLSVFPFTKLFYKVVELIAEAYFEDGEAGLEAACHNIDKWPDPIAGSSLQLPLLGIVIQTQLPIKSEGFNNTLSNEIRNNSISKSTKLLSKIEKISDSLSKEFEEHVDLKTLSFIGSPINLDCYIALGSVVNQLQLLWELVITNQPLVVIASSPIISSMIVQSLVTCISPLSFSEDYRPFFTIHDSEFKEFTGSKTSTPQVIIGITNPFFVKALSHWANILKVVDIKSGKSNDKNLKNPSYLLRQDDIKPGLYSSTKSYLHTDKSFLRSIEKGVKIDRPSYVQSEIIRKFFLEITQSFIFPLERYVASLMPLRKEISPFKNPPPLKKFNMDDFLKSLENNGPQLTTGIKGDWIGLYKLFFSSPNFVSWFSQRQSEITAKLWEIHTDILCRTDLSYWIVNKPEVELVDLIIQINNKMKECRKQNITLSEEQTVQLHNHIATIMTALPPDLQDMLKQSYSGTGAPRSPSF